jgi:hypothetical protein
MTRSQRISYHTIAHAVLAMVHINIPDGSVWEIPVLALLLLNGILLLYRVLEKDPDPEAEATRRRINRLTDIRKLEKDLGYEPLDLDWPEGLLEEVAKIKKEKKP